jgi:hypothetical protein
MPMADAMWGDMAFFRADHGVAVEEVTLPLAGILLS